MAARATPRPSGTFLELEKGTLFSRHFSSICWKTVIINRHIHRDQCDWFLLELCSVQLVPLSMAASEGMCRRKVPNLALGSQRKYHRGGDSQDDISRMDQSIYPKELKIDPQTTTCTRIFRAALFTVLRRWKQPKCLSVEYCWAI